MKRLLVILAIAASMLIAVPATAQADGIPAVDCHDEGLCHIIGSVDLSCPSGKARVFRLRARMLSPIVFGHEAQDYIRARVAAQGEFVEKSTQPASHFHATADNKWHTLVSVWRSGYVGTAGGEVDWLAADHGWWGGVNRRIFVWWGNCRIRPM